MVPQMVPGRRRADKAPLLVSVHSPGLRGRADPAYPRQPGCPEPRPSCQTPPTLLEGQPEGGAEKRRQEMKLSV